VTEGVSVVLPVRDGAKYLAEALDSILTQSYRPTEVIVVDDGSRDATPVLLAEYGRSVRTIRQGRLGFGAALNRGIEASTAALLAFCDADDLWTPARLKRQVAHITRDAACAGVGGLVQQFVSPELPELRATVRVESRPRHVDLLGALLIRRAAVDRVGALDETARIAAGVEWIGRARHLDMHFDALDEVVLLRRIHGANATMKMADQERAGLLWALRMQRGRNRTARWRS
jgi:glycosyltransferase involved in cell wall biosynthesis